MGNRDRAANLIGNRDGPSSRENPLQDLGFMNVREAFVSAVPRKRQLLVIEAEQLQDRGVQVGRAAPVHRRPVAELIGPAIHLPAFDPSSREPNAEPEGMVVAAVLALSPWRAAEFAAPENQRRV